MVEKKEEMLSAKKTVHQNNNDTLLNFKRTASSSSSSNEILNISVNDSTSNTSSCNNLSTKTTKENNSISSLDKSFSSSEKLDASLIKYKDAVKRSEIPTEITPQTIQQKRNRFIKRLSSHTGSFFSKSCPNDDLIDSKSLETQQQPQQQKEVVVGNEKTASRSFFAFANAHKQKLAKFKCKKSFDSSSLYEANNNNSNNKNDTIINDNKNNRLCSSNDNNFYSIASFEIDIEKLTRELSIPTIDKPLTSFKKIEKSCIETAKSTNYNKNTQNFEKKNENFI